MAITGGDLFVKGNIELDGKIYGDGSLLTGITAANPTANAVPVSTGTILVDSGIYALGGNVGVGTTNPTVKLMVGDGTVSAQNAVRIYGDVAANKSPILSLFRSGARESFIAQGTTLNDGLWLGNTPGLADYNDATLSAAAQLTIATTGNVGIGTAAPFNKLHIEGTNGAAAGLYMNSATPNAVSNTLYNNGGSLYWNGSAVSVGGGSGTVNSGLQGYFSYYTATGTTVDDSTVLYTDNTNIGIGTTAPVAKVHVGVGDPNAMAITGADLFVKGNIELDGKIYGDGSQLTSLPAGGAAGVTTNVQYNNAGLMAGSNSFVFDGTNVGIGTSAPVGLLDVNRKLTVLSNGNVGIGTVLPSQLFEVAGGVNVVGTDNSYFATNVGIGSAAPIYKLDVNGTGNITGAVTLGSTLGVTGNTTLTGDIAVNGGDLTTSSTAFNLLASPTTITMGAAATTLGIGAATGTTTINNAIASITGNLGVGTTAPVAKVQVGAGTPNAMAITGGDLFVKGNIEFDGKIYGDGSQLTGLTSSQWITAGSDVYYNTGNVGIGSAVPAAKLDVNGGILIEGINPINFGDSNMGIWRPGPVGTRMYFGAAGAPMVLNDGGNVGIGSVSPGKSLDVAGNIRSSGNVGIGNAIVDSLDTPRITITSGAIEINLQ
jgi:hypothetical protein